MSSFDSAVRTVQFLAVDAVEKAGSGHPGTPMALAGIGVDIFSRYLRYVPEDPAWPNRDRFVLSCGHASMLLYSLLHLSGYKLPLSELKNFRQWESLTPGHPEYGVTPGVETTTGPLGQGFGNAVGMALASRMMAARVNTPDSTLIDYRVFVLTSDGDFMEGVASEAASLAGHLKLDNLICVYDDNHITIDGNTELSFSEDVGRRFEAYGFFVQHVDGHNPEQVRAALDRAVAHTGQPKLIVARTHIGYGSPNKQDSSAAHGTALGPEEVKATKLALGWPLEPDFIVEPEAKHHFSARIEENRAIYKAYREKVSALDPQRKRLFESFSQKRVPENLFDELLKVVESKKGATRSLSASLEQRVADLVPCLVGGAADLAASTKTTIKNASDIKAGEYAGRNMHFGIREHAMAAALNGLALSGFFIPFGSTFLIFSDYLRPALRLSAIMGQQVLYVFTHDSIFVGEDGPTHEPVEQLAALRVIQNLDVVRPADSLECAAAWVHALSQRTGPTAFALSRQNLPPLERPAGFDEKSILAGAYVLADTVEPELVIIATGSEVSVALEARTILERKGKRVRVVSAPCWEAFERQPQAVREQVLPASLRRVSLEAGRTSLWRGVVGNDGITIGVDRYGASAPYERLAEEYGLTGQKVADAILAQL